MAPLRMRCPATVPAANGDGDLQCRHDDRHRGAHACIVWRQPFDWSASITWERETPYIATAWWPCPPDEYDRRAKAARGEDVV